MTEKEGCACISSFVELMGALRAWELSLHTIQNLISAEAARREREMVARELEVGANMFVKNVVKYCVDTNILPKPREIDLSNVPGMLRDAARKVKAGEVDAAKKSLEEVRESIFRSLFRCKP